VRLLKAEKEANQMLKQVQHGLAVLFWSFCHPEPGPELNSGSKDFGISFLGLVISVLRPHPWGGAFFTALTDNFFFHIFNSP
jgi:hypothetical protein